ncbi:hypothetical protein MAFF241647_36420 (plasmid) [Ralstonia solanacearum]|uniref:T6SS phospholipase effector Tle1-like catalytic domain-containing protein n=2 Tax=Ralstonia pseudosolanacearum TaxID=1310165 RepID=UPI0002C0D541|nr:MULTISPECIES: DUF2235 domain-containing protein [Ralstonia]ANH35001.1 hypothetical protein A3768_4179 [Ralstonia solanacearum]MCK4129484.1 DUF2235 domain-containing protein [Ralstonia pseudosolanacearum]AGH86132.1 hypothetical protein F504_3619 [Ralstonia pseudosolanacearum FQY_4]OAI64682.1 hypothetical protein RSP781_17115 [Ralstonia pseudosolanacearum]UZF38288.1 DUF2235 domain-containing protein [Ralstonia sp. RS647]
MAELEPLGSNPFVLTVDEQARFLACRMERFEVHCSTEFHLSVFFDGTNNNRYRDTPRQAHSNVARLFDIFEEKEHQIRIYVPGIGTPFEKEIGDTGRGDHARAGLGAGWGGEARINWALLQITNEFHRLYYGRPLSEALGFDERELVHQISSDLNMGLGAVSTAGRDEVEQLANAKNSEMVITAAETVLKPPRHEERRALLRQRREYLSEKLKALIAGRKPKMLRIRLSVFGFSRGAAEARVFANWLKDALDDDMTLAGVPVSFDFLGIFDTVASVGVANSTKVATGHSGWGEEAFLRIPGYVKRTVHLVSAHEVRGSFPLDKAVAGNCLELAYPGVHTDVGGAYQPGDQGRGCGTDGKPDDSNKLSQITLAKMYREAAAAGVPLNPMARNLTPEVRAALKISPDLIQAYNDYVDAVNPLIRKHGGGTTGAARVQYGLYLRWRRMRLAGGAQAFENQLFFQRAEQYGAQCANDLSVANALLREEAKDLAARENDPAYADGWMQRVQRVLPVTQGVAVWNGVKQKVWGDKVREWREVKAYWNDTAPLDPRIVRICDDYIHDSRAWFKPFGAPSDSVWRMRQQARLEQLKQQDAAWKQVAADLSRDLIGTLKRYESTANGGDGEAAPNPVVGQDRRDLEQYLKDGSVPMETKGREPSSMWGYLRWRTHFAPTPTLGERAQAAWDEVASVPGKVAKKAQEAAHDAEARLANTARKLLEAGQESLERAATDALQRFLGGGVPRF